MKAPSFADAFEVLCLQLADDGRGDVLLGAGVERLRARMRPFMASAEFPSVYLELPLIGEPFLDATVLYDSAEEGMRIDSPAVAGTEPVIDWFASDCAGHGDISFGFEVDAGKPEDVPAAIHFQPRGNRELVAPFCEAAGEPERAMLYLELDERMPEGWGLSFFGMFRGRPGSPLRVCGYLDGAQIEAMSSDPLYMAGVFDRIGFSAYEGAMLAEVSEVAAVAPGPMDFQFDIYPDGTLGETFALDLQFEIEQPDLVRESFAAGRVSKVMELLERWGIADDRWRLVPEAAFARCIPIENADGSPGRFSFTLMPQWCKVRWRCGIKQPAKLYFVGKAGIIEPAV